MAPLKIGRPRQLRLYTLPADGDKSVSAAGLSGRKTQGCDELKIQNHIYIRRRFLCIYKCSIYIYVPITGKKAHR